MTDNIERPTKDVKSAPPREIESSVRDIIEFVFIADLHRQTLVKALLALLTERFPKEKVAITLKRWISVDQNEDDRTATRITEEAMAQDIVVLETLYDAMRNERPCNAEMRGLLERVNNRASFEEIHDEFLVLRHAEIPYWIEQLPANKKLRDIYYYLMAPSAPDRDRLRYNLPSPDPFSNQEIAILLQECLWSFRGQEAKRTVEEAEALCLRFPGHHFLRHVRELARNRRVLVFSLFFSGLVSLFTVLFFVGTALGADRQESTWGEVITVVQANVITALVILSYFLVSRPEGMMRALGLKLAKSISAMLVPFAVVGVASPLVSPWPSMGRPPPSAGDAGRPDASLDDLPTPCCQEIDVQVDVEDVPDVADLVDAPGDEGGVPPPPPACTLPRRMCPEGEATLCVDLRSNLSHCGDCEINCQTVCQNVFAPRCERGLCRCGEVCVTPFRDCDHDAGNGCETDPQSNMQHCGGCDRPCQDGNSRPGTSVCVQGVCRHGQCQEHYANCEESNDDCETDLRSDRENCGRCGENCGLARDHVTSAQCDAGVCALACEQGWGNCDGVWRNGCEENLSSSERNCGSCGHGCGVTEVGYRGICRVGACGRECARNFGHCARGQPDTCILMDTDTNCGSCGQPCGPNEQNHEITSCSGPRDNGLSDYNCTRSRCMPGWVDCDHDRNGPNGCETRVVIDDHLCGGCVNNCAAEQQCRGEMQDGVLVRATCVWVSHGDAAGPPPSRDR